MHERTIAARWSSSRQAVTAHQPPALVPGSPSLRALLASRSGLSSFGPAVRFPALVELHVSWCRIPSNDLGTCYHLICTHHRPRARR